MRKDWEYKKLGEVCINITDGSHNPPKGIDYSEFKMISSQNVFDDMLQITDENVRFLTEEQFIKENKRTNLCKDIVLLTIVGTIGRCCVLSGNEGSLTLQRSVAALKPNSELLSRFLMYLLIGNRKKLENEARGIAQKGVYLKQLTSLSVPLPPKPTQLAIVAELDKLNEMIRLKKQQLEDYDQLAQSIFYEMFGDPVENEKGWEVKKLGEICTIFAGGDKPNDIKQILDKDYKYPVIANGDGSKGVLGYTKNCKVKEDAVTIGARGASIGNCRIVKNGFTPAVRLLTLIPGVFLNCSYLFYIVKGLDYKQNGAGQAQLTVPNIKIETIPLPPLPLQQQFAARIETIEQQKQQVKDTIKDLETLLASRMQYWFD